MKKSVLCCLFLLISQTSFAQSICEGGGQGRGQNLTDQQKKDLELKCSAARRAEASETIVSAGLDEQDCLERAHLRAERKVRDVIQACETKAENLLRCELISSRIIEESGYIRALSRSGEYVERNSDEQTCRRSSIDRAEANALQACQEKFGVSCEISSPGVVSDYHVARRRRFWIVGPKENYQMCTASALAEPSSQYRVQCSVEIRARAR